MLNTGQRTHPGVEETRAKILLAAREIFERNGTRGTTTREVAERAGVNEATLFRHFGSKRALLDAMREEACGIEQLLSIIAALPGDDVGADMHALAGHIVAHLRAKRAMLCVSLAESATGTDDAPEWRGPAQSKAALAAYFEAQIQRGKLRGNPQIMARAFMGLFFSYVVASKLWDPYSAQPVDDLVDIFLNGVIA